MPALDGLAPVARPRVTGAPSPVSGSTVVDLRSQKGARAMVSNRRCLRSCPGSGVSRRLAGMDGAGSTRGAEIYERIHSGRGSVRSRS